MRQVLLWKSRGFKIGRLGMIYCLRRHGFRAKECPSRAIQDHRFLPQVLSIIDGMISETQVYASRSKYFRRWSMLLYKATALLSSVDKSEIPNLLQR